MACKILAHAVVLLVCRRLHSVTLSLEGLSTAFNQQVDDNKPHTRTNVIMQLPSQPRHACRTISHSHSSTATPATRNPSYSASLLPCTRPLHKAVQDVILLPCRTRNPCRTSNQLRFHTFCCCCVLQSAGLENLQELLQIPNHRVPLSAQGVQQSFAAGQQVHQLLHDAHDHHQQQQQQHNGHDASSSSSSRSSKVFMYTSPFLRCIQTAQHVVRALKDEQVSVVCAMCSCRCMPCSPHSVRPCCLEVTCRSWLRRPHQ